MKHTCEHCHTRYEIADEKVKGRFVKVRCQSCHGTMRVVGLDARVHNSVAANIWVGLNGKPEGPYTPHEVALLVDTGAVAARTRMWTSGMASWERVCESDRFAWVYRRIVDQVSAEELARQRENTGVFRDPFAAATLGSDQPAYFADPTLKSGLFMLDADAQAELQAAAAKHGLMVVQQPSPSMWGLALATAGATVAACGFLWALLDPRL
jgi:predicted Zn finger-like uncharacterized protein